MSQEFKREDWLAAKAGSQYVSHEAAAEALDSLDDYARMGTGVDAYGPRGMLERYIAQQAATLRQPAARVDVTEEMMSRACAAYDKRCPGLPMAPSAGIRAALEAALSAQPAPERQGAPVAWTVVGPDGKSSIGGWIDMRYYETAKGMAVLREGHSYAFAYTHPAAPVGVPVGPCHPAVIYWRNDALESAAGIVDRYAEHFPECTGAADDIRAMLAAAPSAPQGTQQGVG